jgi:hypothetical protein
MSAKTMLSVLFVFILLAWAGVIAFGVVTHDLGPILGATFMFGGATFVIVVLQRDLES